MIAQIDRQYAIASPLSTVRRLIARLFFEGRPITTSHRWINHFVFAHFAIEKRLPQLKKVQKPIFVVGTGRSGTTVFGILMSMHQQIGMLSEPKAMWHAIYPHEDVIGHYSKGAAQYRLYADDASAQVVSAAKRIFGAFLFATNTKRVLEKNPEFIFRVPFVNQIFPDAKYIFLVRNGSNTVSSMADWSSREGVEINGETHNWWGVNNRKWSYILNELLENEPDLKAYRSEIEAFTEHKDMAAVEWIITMREGLAQLEKYPQQVYLLRYEDLVENPRQQLRSLFEFCELPEDETCLSYAEERIRQMTVYKELTLPRFLQKPFWDLQKRLGYEVADE